jgi:hypothetical protein
MSASTASSHKRKDSLDPLGNSRAETPAEDPDPKRSKTSQAAIWIPMEPLKNFDFQTFRKLPVIHVGFLCVENDEARHDPSQKVYMEVDLNKTTVKFTRFATSKEGWKPIPVGSPMG